MPNEEGFIEQKETPEQFPSREEIKGVFETHLQGKEYKELRVQDDDKGEVCLYEIEVTLENGEKIEYNFQKAKNNYRDKTLPAGAQFSASIHTVIYDATGMPVGGECAANYLDGKWEYPSA